MRRVLAIVGVAVTVSAGTAAIAAVDATPASALDSVTWCKGLPPARCATTTGVARRRSDVAASITDWVVAPAPEAVGAAH
jgi:hypothetical protein